MSRQVSKHPSRLFADISSYQGHFDAEAYRKAGHLAVGLKVTEGVDVADSQYSKRVGAAHRAGLRVLHYHFAHPDNRSYPGPEVNNFLDHAHIGARDIVVLDIEVGLDKPYVRRWVKDFNRQVNRRTGKRIVIYTYDSALGKFTGIVGRRWAAAYRSRLGHPAWAWQYTDGIFGPGPHHAEGIGACDMSRINLVTWFRWRRAAKRA